MYYKMNGKYENIDENTGEYLINDITYLINHIDNCVLSNQIFIKAIYKEDSITLYGFNDKREHLLFTKLIAMRGLGPKTAMNILSSAPMIDLDVAIDQRDADVFAKAKGVSINKAKQIVFDLTGVLVDTKTDKIKQTLKGLGYNPRQLSLLDQHKLISESFDEKIIEAIRHISNA